MLFYLTPGVLTNFAMHGFVSKDPIYTTVEVVYNPGIISGVTYEIRDCFHMTLNMSLELLYSKVFLFISQHINRYRCDDSTPHTRKSSQAYR